MDGIELTREIRERSQVPIIVLSVRSQDSAKVSALDVGADDYITKPFSIQELLARIRAALRRSPTSAESDLTIYRDGDLEIDFEGRRVTLAGKSSRLTPKEFDLLRLLAANLNKAVPHRKLLQAVWGPDYGEETEYLRFFVNQLRKKIEPPGAKPTFITTEPRIGYRFVMENVRTPAEPVAAT